MRMSDEEYQFYQEIKEKKQAGRGAFHKKCGAKSKKCTLPSDHMTKKEREAMNGPVISYNPNAWYSWEEFKHLPDEYRIKYVNSLMTRFNCSLAAIAEVVFGTSSSNLWALFKRHGSLQYVNLPDSKIGKKLLPGKQKLKEAMEKDLWPNRDEIQNGSEPGNGEGMSSESNSCEITLTGGGSKYEKPDELTLEEKVAEAIDTVTLYATNGVPMSPEKIDEVFVEKTGMTRKEAEKAVGFTWENPGEPMNNKELSEDFEDIEDSTNVSDFSIIMDHVDMSIISYIQTLFEGKKISVAIEVHEERPIR